MTRKTHRVMASALALPVAFGALAQDNAVTVMQFEDVALTSLNDRGACEVLNLAAATDEERATNFAKSTGSTTRWPYNSSAPWRV